MKKAMIRLLAAALALMLVPGSFCARAEGGEWTCDNCGQAGNTGNFCPNCGAPRPSGSWECDNCGETGNIGNFCTNCGAAKPPAGAQEEEAKTLPDTAPASIESKLKMKLSTRSGPGTDYEETGTFFGKNWKKQTVTVTGKAWDGSMWWAQVDFRNGKKAKYRVWTGFKRLDLTDAETARLVEITKQGTLHVDATEAYCGPGTDYAKLGDVLFFEDGIDFYGWENGFVEIDYYDVNREIQRRVWVPEKKVSGVKWK